MEDLLGRGSGSGNNGICLAFAGFRLSLQLRYRRNLIFRMRMSPVRTAHALLCHKNHLRDSMCDSGFFIRRYLKTKKMTNISQRRGRFEAKTRRNPSGFQVFLTKKQSAFVEIVKIFDFSDTPYSPKKNTAGQSLRQPFFLFFTKKSHLLLYTVKTGQKAN